MDAPARVVDAFTKLIDAFKQASNPHFESRLTQLQETISRIEPISKDMKNLNLKLDEQWKKETEELTRLLDDAKKVASECKNTTRWNLYTRYRFKVKLDNQMKHLMKFIQNYVKIQALRNSTELSKAFKDIQEMIEKCWSGSFSSAGVPSLQGPVMGFKSPVKALKEMLLKDYPVVVVSGPGGCGKTTLVTMLCNDDEIKNHYGRNIHFASIGEHFNKQEVVQKLLPISSAGEKAQVSKDDPGEAWRRFLNDHEKKAVLLVLDDVHDFRKIDDIFKCDKAPGYKILVTSKFPTSKTPFERCTYTLAPLEDEDAMNLLCYSAFSKNQIPPTYDIPDDLLKQLINRCKKNPRALTVVGGLLKDARGVEDWKSVLKKLPKDSQSILKDHRI